MQALAFRHRLSVAALIALLLVPASAAGQVSTPPAGIVSVTFAGQWIDNTGHMVSNGRVFERGQSVTSSVLAEIDFGVTDRLAATVSVPYTSARYTGDLPSRSGLGHDECQCWQQSLQDFSIAGRYRFGDNFWGLTPQMRFIIPSHDYEYHGEAVVGSNLNQALLGISGFWRLGALPKATINAGYTFALVQEAVDGLRTNRSNTFASVGYALLHSLYVHGGLLYQRTHGGLTTRELFDPSLPADQFAQSDRLVRARYWHVTGGLSYSVGSAADVFFAVEPYVWGRDTHDGIAYTLGATWYFDFSR